MANLKSSKKDIRRSAKKREANLSVRTGLKTYVKRVRQAIEAGDKTKVAEELKMAQKSLDKAAQRGIIHKKQAARRKSRIASQAAKANKA
ncbi:MAG TPA: 30S ribosomal protein S20 [Fimbriimonadaceae bacterium]|nr:30S ribosomal protein S20 [Fimbriimonadaceae bacterium]